MQKKRRKGFTLVELLVTIAIIGILTSFGTVAFSNTQQKARDARRKGDLSAIKTALELYKSNNGSYPTTTGWRGSCSGFGNYEDSDTLGEAWIPGLAPTYIQRLPHDPREGQSFSPGFSPNGVCYIYYSPDGVEYKVASFFGLETTLDPNDPFSNPPGHSRVAQEMQVSVGPNAINW